ncbi:hypothetical protein SODALDRAFT_20364 [Sodiomyces alkalinus F11]|uniref:Zn(2)-C6 fungal-type domain-containing protein n=1 Tax=Sodiomyces alkalinus (strain CBS 110278 / VKM F-3762 / F11) TaxID=1314773 RepID=A0A3N2Q7D2_SODAK|nr:hypothetical protein SODALDRAFT_20364 [Sodiomyces alkalinus F11]ROT42652.1 hypothetical protein SODALDRAFT_20364 [Sodiomyces alkalinus F11]
MSQSAAAAKRQQRRIPDALRKRNAKSCDLCRKRRCRCVPSPNSEGCVTCREHNVPCTYTAPRKTRFYGSVDDLSDRYRCLDAIVKGAFPNDPTSTAADLLQLGQRMGYLMPDLAHSDQLGVDELVRAPESSGPTRPSSTTSDSRETGDRTSPGSGPAIPVAGGSGADSVLDAAAPEPDEPHISLIRGPSGIEHYVGPSGSLNFLSQLRRLIISTQVATEEAHTERVSKFTQDHSAQALEADETDDPQDPGVDVPQGVQGTAPGLNAASPAQASGGYGPDDGLSPSALASSIARDFTRMPVVDLDEMLRGFPPDDILEMLIHAYFKNVHDDFPLFHRPTFENEYELYVVQARRYLRMAPITPIAAIQGSRPLPDWGWVGCLHMMMVFGSISNPRIPGIDHYKLRRECIAAARLLLPHFVSKCTLSNVRVLLLLSLFLHNNSERNAAWNLVGAATRISFALGLHRSDMSSAFRPLDREVRKWVFCTLYAFEQFLASSLGRPSGLQEMDVEVIPPREGFLEGGSGMDAKLVSLSLKLQAVLAKTRFMYARPRKLDAGPPLGPAKPTIEDILKSLATWKQEVVRTSFNLPSVKSGVQICGTIDDTEVVGFDELKLSLSWKTRSQLRAVLLLHIQYHHIAIVCTRPVLLREIAAAQKPRAAQDDKMNDDGGNGAASMSPVSDICLYHACQLAYLVLLLDAFQLVNGLSGLDVFYAYAAAMVLILRLLRRPLRPEEAQAPRSRSRSREAEVLVLVKDLVLRVQAVIHRTEKSGSMKRFANVVDAFAECTSETGRQRLGWADSGQAEGQQAWVGGNGGVVTAPGETVAVGVHGQPPGVPGFNPQAGTGTGTGTVAMPLHPEQAMVVRPGPNEAAHLETPTNMWPLSTFGAMGVQLDDGGLCFQSTGNDPGAAPEWGDMETVFATYGIP